MSAAGLSKPRLERMHRVLSGVYQVVHGHPEPWPEAKARREIIRLLRAVTPLHSTPIW